MSHQLHLSLQENPGNVPLCVVRGGKLDGEVIFSSETPDKPAGKQRLLDVAQADLSKAFKEVSPKERAQIQHRLGRAMRLGKAVEEDIQPLYDQAVKQSMTSLNLTDGTMQVLPSDVDGRATIVALGAAGSGKSYLIGKFAEQMQQLHPDSEIYILSRCRDDPAFAKLKNVHYVDLDESFAEDRINCDDFAPGSILIFDDVHTLNHKPTLEAVLQLQRDALEVGRKRCIHVLSTVHCTDGRRTKHLWEESGTVVIYPHGSSPHAIRYILERHCSLSKNDVSKILKLNSRWVAVKRSYPLAVVHEHGCYLPTVE